MILAGFIFFGISAALGLAGWLAVAAERIAGGWGRR